MFAVFALVLSMFIGASLQVSTPTSPTYEAGVVEFNYVRGEDVNAVDALSSILAEYLAIMNDAPSTLDIIVFPEMTLNGMETAVEIPETSENVAPCDDESFPVDNLVKQISCSAKRFYRYVVVNMVTKAKCPDAEMIANGDSRSCADRADGFSYYNTNVVFSRNGTLISRYRKFNLFGEVVDKPAKPAMVVFDTDFGVKFGHFICFDLMFRFPALELVHNLGVTDVIFPTMWFSELPFLTAVQVQQNWAYSNNVNLLAAGANNPSYGSTGTGIYAARKGSLISVMEGAGSSMLYTATVPKRGLGDSIQITQNSVKYSILQMKDLKLKRDQLDRYHIKFLEEHKMTPGASMESEECYGDFCCNFKYSFNTRESTEPHYSFALAVYHGNRTFDGFADGGVVACAVLACQSRDIATCGVRNESLAFIHQWYELKITGTFPYGDQFFYLPTTLDSSVMPFRVEEFDYEATKVSTSGDAFDYQISMESRGDLKDDFYAFGIYGRDFNMDETDAAGVVQMSTILITIVAAFIIIKNLY